MPFPDFLMPNTPARQNPALATNAGLPNAISAMGGMAASVMHIGFHIQPQQQTNWCWAAVSTSVSAFFQHSSSWSQCDVANVALSRSDCCSSGAADPTKCNRPWFLEAALGTTGNLSRVDARSLTFMEIQSEIRAFRPIGCRIAWHDNSGHFLTVVGFVVASSGEAYIDIADPIFLNSQIAFRDFAALYQAGATWMHSYWTQPASTGGAMALAGLQPSVTHPDAIGA